jgi:O-antigen biosynthesis protein
VTDLSNEMLTWQPDLFQRYELLRQVVERVSDGVPSRPIRIIDVGSGPERLTERALGPDYSVVRTDVGDFDDVEIVRIYPGAPLPFEDGAADIVIAMDVLEHVAEPLRPAFLAECKRVAGSFLVVTCPTESAAVVKVERELSDLMVALANKPIDFLDEHSAFGLPAEESIVAELGQDSWNVAVLDNAPLPIWSSTNLIDFVLNLRLGPDAGARAALNATINDDAVVCPRDEPGYRKFFIASPNGGAAAEVIASELMDDRAVPSVSAIVATATERFASELLSQRNDTELEAKQRLRAEDTIEALQLRIEALDAAIRNARRSSEAVNRARLSAEEQLRTARRELAAANVEYLELAEAVPAVVPLLPGEHGEVAQPSAAPSPTVRSIAGKVRRSPRWGARKARGALRRVARPTTPSLPMDDQNLADAPDQPERFDRHWYMIANPDVADVGMDPWFHYVHHGQYEGRSAHPLFDRGWYSAKYPESTARDVDPFLTWATDSFRTDPNEFFDCEWYLARHPEVALAGLDPVEHYRLHGWREGRWPGPLFDPNWYLGTYPDVAAAHIDPLTHYLQYGRGEGRHANHLEHVAATGSYRPPEGLIPWFNPVTFRVSDALAEQPRLNVLLPGMGVRHLTGGPNTAIQLAYRLAATGQSVRFIATDAALDENTSALWEHMVTISDVGHRLANVEVIDGSNRHHPVEIGENDLFMATAWWTAQSVKAALPLVRQQRFLYLIQDFEPLFFASSSQYALALETYDLDHVPIVNSRFLLDHLAMEGVGRFADPHFVESALVFEPTVDRTLFRPTVPSSHRLKRRLLFYARPVNGLRNLFELGTAAVQLAVQQGILDESEWEFCGMGEQFSPVAVGPRSVMRPLPWKDFAGYAEQMRESDILVSLMLAPHPSYPPLEMAACGGVSVTTEFGPKTKEGLSAISRNIIGTPATIEGIAQGLADAVERLDDIDDRLAASSLGLPETWDDVFEDVLPAVREMLDDLGDSVTGSSTPAPVRPPDRYNRWRARRLEDRRSEYPVPRLPDPVTFSLVTAVWNTPGEYLRELADSVLAQELSDGWEWVIADNGSTNPDTLAVLDDLRGDPRIKIESHPVNLGILGGMRSCLDRAVGRYIVHLDHDDLITADALRVVASSLDAHGWPRAFYSDEDKVDRHRFLEPYLKPGWDPVLFVNSCYIAHLCGVDRKLAIEVDAYLDPYTEASPDWDLFMRVSNAGVVPHHVPEVVYSWRIHASSTAGNPSAKPYAVATHRRVLERFVEARADFDHFTVEVHPDSPDQLDWWIRRRRLDPRPLVSVVIGDGPANLDPVALVDHSIHHLAVSDVDRLREIAADAVDRNALIHILNVSAQPLRSDWYWEALGLFELHPDVVGVGGPIERDQRISSAGDVFGFGPTGWGSPEHGAAHNSRGWFSQNLKQRSVDGVAGDHAVFQARSVQSVLAAGDLADLSTLGAWLSLGAATSGHRIAYSPLLRARVERPFHEQWMESISVEIGRVAATRASGRNRSPHLSLEPSDPFGPTTRAKRDQHLVELEERPAVPSITYHDWLVRQIETRSQRFPAPTSPPSLSVITPVYSGTDASLLAELGSCLADQTVPPLEWIIGIDGEISADLRRLIDTLVASAHVRTTGGPKAGILGTMRACLAECSGDYLVPIDADDLLTPDALAILASVAASEDLPDLVHSDEDVLDGDRHRDPFLRPDWDPVLHLSGSYVWHALCIKRSTAVDLGLYSDPSFEWCHDWDTVERIRRIGGRIVHVPEVLYHWRRHAGSSTNTDRPESAQQDSVKAMFTRMATDTGHPERYEVAEFPLWRGATEFHLRRKHLDAPSVALVSLGEMSSHTRSSVAANGPFPFDLVRPGPERCATTEQLADTLRAVESRFVWILDSDVLVGGTDTIWEAVKWFELLPDVGAVCGRIVADDGQVASGAEFEDPGARAGFRAPMSGRSVKDPGPYAIALKPHTIDMVDVRCLIAERGRLLQALGELPSSISIDRSGLLLARSLGSVGWRVMYSPLVIAATAEMTPQVKPAEPVARPGRGLGPMLAATRRFV